MISPPKRSVTRFFIPMIDVLILLFCIFLLMPFVSKTEEATATATTTEGKKTVTELEAELAVAKRKVKELVKDRPQAADQFLVRVLEIDKTTGKLFAYDPDAVPTRQEVKSHAEAQRLIDKQRATAAGKKKEVFFLILYPRELSGFPLQSQVDTYRKWFRDVPHGFDNPLSGD